MIKTIAVAFAIAALTGTPAAATVYAGNPQSIVTALQNAGYKATLDKDSEGDPMIKTSMSGLNVSILFYGCTKNADCESIQFNTGLDLDKGMALEKVNEWSRNKRWGKVYLDEENDPFVEFDVMIGSAGLPDKTFADTVGVYEKAIADFKSFVDF